MKSKTINAVITKKINDWLSHITDSGLVTLLKRDIIVTGGCITSMLLNEDINDFDVYFKTKETTKAVATYYANLFNKNNENRTTKLGKPLHAWVLDGKDLDDWKNDKIALPSFAYGYTDIPYRVVKDWTHTNDEANEDDSDKKAVLQLSGMLMNTPIDRIKIMVNSDGIAQDSDAIADANEYDINKYLDAVGDGDAIDSNKMEENTDKYKPIFISTNAITLSNKIQLITRFYGTPEEIHSNYDFIHVTNYWESSTGKVVLNTRALEAILNKELWYVGSKYPIASLVRTRKFIKRGWQINAGQYVKMAFQISNLDLGNIYVLEDQLVGVDSIYFLSFIESMKTLQMKDPNMVITPDYVTTVIDKVFG